MEKQRLEYIDLAKGICIVLVVFMHIVPELGKGNPYLVNLRMPLYFFLSGMFFKSYGGLSNFFVKKADRLLLPFIAWYLISYGIYYIRVLALGHPEHVFNIMDLFLDSEFYNGSIWFLLSLFWVNLLYFGVNNITNEIYKILSIALIATIGWIWSFSGVQNFLYLGTSMVSLPFFYMGTVVVSKNLLTNNKDIKKDILKVFICLLVIFLSITLPESPVRYTFYLNRLEEGNPVMLYFAGFFLVYLTLILCKYVKKLPLISYLGRFSIIVLLTHGLVRNVTTRSLGHLMGVDTENMEFHLFLFFFTMTTMFFIIPICRKFFPYICAQKSWIENKIKLRKELAA